MQTIDVSVIIPTHNRLAMLEAALDSVLAQDFAGRVEVIVVDDNSRDGTSEIVTQKYPQVHLISLKQNVGAYVARNQAIQESQGQHIAFLDSDDLWQPHYLTTQIAALQGNDRSFCVSDVIIWRVATNQKEIRGQQPNLSRYGSSFHHLLVGGSFICTPSSVVFPRQVFDQVGCFNETSRIAGDTDFYLRCLIAGYTPIFTNLPLVTWREHGNQLTHIKNDQVRMQGRLLRAQKYYALIEKQEAIVSLQQIYAEIYLNFAGKYCINLYFLHWLSLSLKAAHYSSLSYIMSNMMAHFKLLVIRQLRSIKHLVNNLVIQPFGS